MRKCAMKKKKKKKKKLYFILLLFLIYRSLTTLCSPSRSPFLTSWRCTLWEWHKGSLRVNTRLQRESAINRIHIILLKAGLVDFIVFIFLFKNVMFVDF